MKAEAIYSIYIALPPQEQKRLKQMINLTSEPKEPIKNIPSVSDFQKMILKSKP